VQSVGTVREWHTEEGWGVIDCPDTPGGCWVHFSHLFHEDIPPPGPGEVVHVSGGFREAFAGETVDFDWERPEEDKTATSFAPSPRGPAGGRPHTAPSATSRLAKALISVSN